MSHVIKVRQKYMEHAEMKQGLLEGVRLGAIHLNSKDLPAMKAFYHQMVGLEIMSETKDEIVLGYGERSIIILHLSPQLPLTAKQEAGLYHSAILFSSRADLARTLKRILLTSLHSYGGSGDHLVSEAFYFLDPEGNGLELYYDRPKDTWKWQNGQVQMDVRFIDAAEYIHRYSHIDEPSARQLGHVHLKVGDIQQAEHFYTKLLGMVVTAKLPEAVFVSADGYHHHFGLNTWQSQGATARGDSLGLGRVDIEVPASAYTQLLQRLTSAKVLYKQNADGISVPDPWNNQLRILVRP